MIDRAIYGVNFPNPKDATNGMKVKEKRLRGKRGDARLERQPAGKEGRNRGRGTGQEVFNGPGTIVEYSIVSLFGSPLEVSVRSETSRRLPEKQNAKIHLH